MTTLDSPRNSGGSALIITLFFVSIITVVVVASLTNARFERVVANSHFEQGRAGEFAREGVERAVATLQRQTAYKYATLDPSTGATTYRYRNYLTRPGSIVVPSANPVGDQTDATTQNVLAQSVPLSTGIPLNTASTDPVYTPPSLNIPSFVQQSYPTYVIDDRLAKPTATDPTSDPTKPPAMKLKWVYVHQDPNPPAKLSAFYDDPADPGTIPTGDARPRNDSMATDLPKVDPAYPIVGRFAYWTDDESTKINYNLAWKKGTAASLLRNRSVLAHPSRISLQALLLPGQSSSYPTETQVDTVQKWITTTTAPNPGRYFNSFEDARQIGQVDASIPPLIDYNNFELTHYNHDPDTTFFGEDRILLTTNPSLVPKNPDGSYARKFLDILREDQTPAGQDFRTYASPPDPGIPNNIAGGLNAGANKLDPVVKNLVRYINQTNWPLCSDPNASFQKKYYPNAASTSPAVAQLAMAIIDYVRQRESAQPIVPGTRAGYLPNTTTFSTDTAATTNSANAYQGYGRYPYCTEMGVVIESKTSTGVTQCPDGTSNGWPKDSAGKNKTLYRCCAQYEFHLPLRCNLPNGIVFATPPKTVAPTERWVLTPLQNGDHAAQRYVEGEDQIMYSLPPNLAGYDFGYYQPAISTTNCKIYNPNGTSLTTLMPGGYAVVTIPYYRVQPSETSPQAFALRVVLERNYVPPSGLIDARQPTTDPNFLRALIVPQSSSPAVNYKPQSFAGGDFDAFCKTMLSVETDDPRCCVASVDWVAGTASSWGARSTRWSAGKAPPVLTSPTPQQDTDSTGSISDYSLYMPPPKIANSTDPENGRVTSVGELGYVSTGLSANPSAVTAAAGGSTSWRTLRLQGSYHPATDVLPDWAFVDLFAVPNDPATKGRELYNPHGNSVGGRININSAVTPFTDVARDRGLVGIFYGANDPVKSAYDTSGAGTPGTPTPFQPSEAEQIALNIANQTLVLKTAALAPKQYGTMKPTAALTTPAYDTPGELCEIRGIGDRGEKGEDLIREVSSLTCTRGGVFSVYTIGQSIKQGINGKLIVTSEQRQQTMVERYVESWNNAKSDDDLIRFRTVYARNLTP